MWHEWSPMKKLIWLRKFAAGVSYILKTVTGAIVHIMDAVAGPMDALSVAVEPVQSGTGDPSPTNVRPISGWDSVTVNRTGKNLLKYPYKKPSGTVGNISITVNQDGTLTYSGTDSSIRWFSFYGANSTTLSQLSSLADLGLNGGDTVTITNGSTGRFLLQFNKADGTLTSPTSLYKDGIGSTTGTIPYDAVYVYIGLRFSANTAYSAENVGFQIELGSTATAYEPYNGNTYTIQLGETVYGGTLDVVNGKMTVDRASVDMGTGGWSSASASGSTSWKPSDMDAYGGSTSAPPFAFCDMAKVVSVSTFNSNVGADGWFLTVNASGTFYLMSPNLIGLNYTQIKTALSGKQIVYRLATPFELTLTPVQIATLQGTNNVWSDAGDVTVTYRASAS